MNKQIKELYDQALETKFDYSAGVGVKPGEYYSNYITVLNPEKFAELIVEAVLDQVAERAYYTGDRDWSDELDRPWIQLEFGYGSLADAKKGIFK